LVQQQLEASLAAQANKAAEDKVAKAAEIKKQQQQAKFEAEKSLQARLHQVDATLKKAEEAKGIYEEKLKQMQQQPVKGAGGQSGGSPSTVGAGCCFGDPGMVRQW
jgi:hypothetical protein